MRTITDQNNCCSLDFNKQRISSEKRLRDRQGSALLFRLEIKLAGELPSKINSCYKALVQSFVQRHFVSQDGKWMVPRFFFYNAT